MAQVALRLKAVTNLLLEPAHIGKTSVALALPQAFRIKMNLEVPTVRGDQRDFIERLTEGRKQLLSKPGAAQQPLALSAVVNTDT